MGGRHAAGRAWRGRRAASLGPGFRRRLDSVAREIDRGVFADAERKRLALVEHQWSTVVDAGLEAWSVLAAARERDSPVARPAVKHADRPRRPHDDAVHAARRLVCDDDVVVARPPHEEQPTKRRREVARVACNRRRRLLALAGEPRGAVVDDVDAVGEDGVRQRVAQRVLELAQEGPSPLLPALLLRVGDGEDLVWYHRRNSSMPPACIATSSSPSQESAGAPSLFVPRSIAAEIARETDWSCCDKPSSADASASAVRRRLTTAGSMKSLSALRSSFEIISDMMRARRPATAATSHRTATSNHSRGPHPVERDGLFERRNRAYCHSRSVAVRAAVHRGRNREGDRLELLRQAVEPNVRIMPRGRDDVEPQHHPSGGQWAQFPGGGTQRGSHGPRTGAPLCPEGGRILKHDGRFEGSKKDFLFEPTTMFIDHALCPASAGPPPPRRGGVAARAGPRGARKTYSTFFNFVKETSCWAAGPSPVYTAGRAAPRQTRRANADASASAVR
eukprot:CAMPEP_0184283870 /NCGR_PEP_ID=MMETSP0977-20130417/65890_1 /TAXON_ID=483370 /ORGANISM="non described non described, Strain CCMP2097" /LENGTH=505 /DNA_ID=CAMNT_0026589881 /DNA_START=133 /DNA_END=1649 /DNA_ORIENTATION=+